mmetsp:Transcript_9030/g.26144  ORF Transcript_9030/g.26144 Transcript_9030/m.26144 type:complete len:213 (+) Transcript_9030:58-696(+)
MAKPPRRKGRRTAFWRKPGASRETRNSGVPGIELGSSGMQTSHLLFANWRPTIEDVYVYTPAIYIYILLGLQHGGAEAVGREGEGRLALEVLGRRARPVVQQHPARLRALLVHGEVQRGGPFLVPGPDPRLGRHQRLDDVGLASARGAMKGGLPASVCYLKFRLSVQKGANGFDVAFAAGSVQGRHLALLFYVVDISFGFDQDLNDFRVSCT